MGIQRLQGGGRATCVCGSEVGSPAAGAAEETAGSLRVGGKEAEQEAGGRSRGRSGGGGLGCAGLGR